MWPFTKKYQRTEIRANSINVVDGHTVIDVRGQTCPGYLLAISKAVDRLDKDTSAKLLITYPPCGEDVKAWCKERNIQFLGVSQEEGMWIVQIKK